MTEHEGEATTGSESARDADASVGGVEADAETGSEADVETGSEVNSGPLSQGTDEKLPGGSVQTGTPETVMTGDELGWRGWLLVGVVFVSFLVVPSIIVLFPESQWLIAALGLSWRQAYIVFPMLPAILLAVVAVWAALRTQSPEE